MNQNDEQLDFLNTLTMAEIAKFENIAGINFTDMDTASPTVLMPALTMLALNRLGVEVDKKTALQLTFEELNEIFKAASKKMPSRPDEINKILETVRGK